jgi:hypothetical protein
MVKSQLTGPPALLASTTASGAHVGGRSRLRDFSSLLAALAAFGLLLAVTLATLTGFDSTQLQPTSPPAISPQAPSLPQSSTSPGTSNATSDRAAHAYAKLPLSFVPNAGQADKQIRYYAQGAGFSFSFSDDKAVLAFEKGDRGQALELRFLGANPNAKLTALDRGQGRVNYLTGSKRHTDLPTYNQLVYRDRWPGIDMVFRGKGGKLEYEFRLHPGAKPSDIRLAYAGAESLSLGAGGALLIDTPLGTLRDSKPTSYQRIGGRRAPVASRYTLAGSSYGFALGHYDRGQPLVIDPSLVYSTYLGGSGVDFGQGIAVDSQGAAYVTGFTRSTDFPVTAGAFDTSANGGFEDAFVTKLSPSGSSLDYSTYLGGEGADNGFAIAVDSLGAAYVTGETQGGGGFPTTAGAFDTALHDKFIAFVTKLSPSGSSLTYSTFLGGPDDGEEAGRGIAIDTLGAAYVTGNTSSEEFPTTAGAFDTSFDLLGDAFLTKLNSTGSGLVYSTYLGGSGDDIGRGIAVDSLGTAYVTGETRSSNFPTAAAFDSSLGLQDAFATKLSSTGSTLAYSTYLGGSGGERGSSIAVDGAGSAYVTGDTSSSDFPTTAGAFDTSYNIDDAFVTKLNASGAGLAYSTYLGGSGSDQGYGITVDGQGAAHVTGATNSSDFPTTAGAYDTNGGGAFVTKLNASGAGLAYSTYLDGSRGLGVAIDSQGTVYVTGYAGADFPTTAGAFDTTFNGVSDAFVTKLLPIASPTGPATITLSPADAVNNVGTTHTVTATVKDAGGQPVPNTTVRFSVTGATTTSGSCTTNTSGQCSFSYQGPNLPGADLIDAYADTDNDNVRDPGEPEAVPATKAWILPTSTAGHVTGGGQIRNSLGNDKVAFGFNAKSDANAVKGECTVVDPSTDTMIKCIDATVVNTSATHATIFGNAKVNGVASTYRIDVDDLAEPGTGSDTFKIQTSSGYTAGGTLKSGNIQIH